MANPLFFIREDTLWGLLGMFYTRKEVRLNYGQVTGSFMVTRDRDLRKL